ncbi:hypothetical protein BT96DRAFT_925849 [Gymnopus androsaceus JB14]|uniref:Uncharacterized protein n=1 Tax=Gymnopus androsaceus JB14 TaxID=1447944 RepID=A0A6A4GX69_9AGAR|nr:hypothetical protein BT96DRAFT_925849 [Gymnopus androsaceus JB14]
MSKTLDVSLDKAAFLGLWVAIIHPCLYRRSHASFQLESVLYGCHATAFLFSLWLFRISKSETVGKKFNPVLTFLVLTALFALSTTHVSINLARGVIAFVSYQGAPNGASTYLKQLWVSSNVAKQAAYVTNILISDSFALYRSYIVISNKLIQQQVDKPPTCNMVLRNKTFFLPSWCEDLSTLIIAFPICSLLASVVCGYKSVYNVSQRMPGEDAFMPAVLSLRTSLLVLSLVTNALVTLIIVVFLAWNSRQNQSVCRRACVSSVYASNA